MARTPLLVTIMLAFVGLVLSGCAASGPQWADEGASYTLDSVKAVFDRVEEPEALGSAVAESADLRHDALVGLRRRGETAAQATDLITATFPSTAGVPVYVERATFDGEDALLVVELIGPADGSLNDLRLWVVSDDGDVLFSAVK